MAGQRLKIGGHWFEVNKDMFKVGGHWFPVSKKFYKTGNHWFDVSTLESGFIAEFIIGESSQKIASNNQEEFDSKLQEKLSSQGVTFSLILSYEE